jgi:CDP-diacylglycerol---glycerol-3-phosphate 3-phosphatidyltransferase
MSWPHVLSFSRLLAAPVVAALALQRPGDVYLLAAIVFTLASLTDLLDGQLARYSRRSNTLGVFLDTTADKVLVAGALVGMSVAQLCPAWIAVAVIGREFVISGLRSYAATQERVISAHIWGKGKAAITMCAIPLVLLAASGRAGGLLGTLASHARWTQVFDGTQWLLVLCALLTLVSGLRYVVDARPLFRPTPRVAEAPSDQRTGLRAGSK